MEKCLNKPVFTPTGLDFQASSWLWTEKVAAQFRGCSVSTLQKERHRHTGMPYLKLGRLVRYRPEDVMAYCFQRRIDPNDQ